MFFDDLQTVRQGIIKVLLQGRSASIQTENRFAKERSLFMNELEKSKASHEDTRLIVKKLEQALQREKDFQASLFVENHVELLCTQASQQFKIEKMKTSGLQDLEALKSLTSNETLSLEITKLTNELWNSSIQQKLVDKRSDVLENKASQLGAKVLHLNEKLEKQTEELFREKSKTKDLSELVQQLKQK